MKTMIAWWTAAVLILAATGAAAQGKVPRVGYLAWTNTGLFAEVTSRGFFEGLRQEGFVDGTNVNVIQRVSADPDRFADLTREITKEGVDVFFAPATPMATAAWYASPWYASPKIPIVIATIADPKKLEFVESLSRPGTRVTGVTTLNDELTLKRLELLTEFVPELKRLGVIASDAMRIACDQEEIALRAAAKRLGIELVFADVARGDDVDAAFRRFAEQDIRAVANTLLSSPQGMDREIVEASLRYRIPTMNDLAEAARIGAMVSYGPDFEDLYRRAGRYVGKILKGGDPAVMPMEQPREFRLVVNLRTAQTLGITIPPSVLVRADELIQ